MTYRLLELSFVVVILPLAPFWTSVSLLYADSLSTTQAQPPRVSLQHDHRPQDNVLSCSDGFIDDVCEFLDRQPNVAYRRVQFPRIILGAFPTKPTNCALIELERKNENANHEVNENTIALHLIPTPTQLEECLPPKFQKDVTDYFNREKDAIHIRNSGTRISQNERSNPRYAKVIHLHQDIWNSKREIVRHRLMAQLGNNDTGRSATTRRIFARKTVVRRISASVAMEFLDDHHLWGATKAKHNYGLFVRKSKDATVDVDVDVDESELVAVATFSTRRKIVRSGKAHRSHELLRFCSRKDSNVVGGISKLIKAFVTEKIPDDIVTVVDRDWGDGSGWYPLGFHSVATMDPIVMAVQPFNKGESQSASRRHLVGAGIKIADTSTGNSTSSLNNKDRVGLSADVLQELDALDSTEDILGALSNHGFFPVYDTGVERLMKVISYDRNAKEHEPETTRQSVVELWKNSQPTYAKEYYSPNLGIAALLKHAASTPSALSQLITSSTTDRLGQ
eukprot:jgi/Psemu1/184276/e_gw1.38.142.1